MREYAWLSWTFVGLLAALCGLLAFLQNRWIDEFSRAENERLHAELDIKLSNLSRQFNAEITRAVSALLPNEGQIERLGRRNAYSAQYLKWSNSHDRTFSRIALAVPEDGSLEVWNLDLENGMFSRGDWPSGWDGVREQLMAPASGGAPFRNVSSNVIVVPRRNARRAEDPGPFGAPSDQEWFLAELNLHHVRTTMLPELLRAYFNDEGKLDYEVQVVASDNPSNVIFESGVPNGNQITGEFDASIGLFDLNERAFRSGDGLPPPFADRMPPPGGPAHMAKAGGARMIGFPDPPPDHGGPGRVREGRGPGIRPPPDGRGPERPTAPPSNLANGRWRLLVRHKAGSLEAVVAQARWHNIAVSAGILFLILATAGTLLRFSRRSQELAQVKMDFVAGVSHELKTPITVIRTAAFNLRDELAKRPEQVERYGQLIQEQSQRLASLVDQILRFSSAEAGHVIRTRAPVEIGSLISEIVRSTRAANTNPELLIEEYLAPDLPAILADEQALKHAVQNLIDNALKYGIDGVNWIGIFASGVEDSGGLAVEIRIADRGPGIPREEQTRIFEPFFRGQRAVENQIHGTGLGLNLVKKIVEAHAGILRLTSEPFERTEFVIRIPAAAKERKYEFAHSVS